MTMRSVSDLRDRASAACSRHLATWSCQEALSRTSWPGASLTTPELVLVLQPPTEAQALADMAGVAAWVVSWREAERRHGGSGFTLEWAERQWAAAGHQILPQRAHLESAEAIAALAGRSAEYRRMVARGTELAGFAGRSLPAKELSAVLTRVLRKVAGYEAAEYHCLVALLAWWREQDPRDLAGMYLRQIPVPGLDTKWLERHQGVIADILPLLRPLDQTSENNWSTPAASTASSDSAVKDEHGKELIPNEAIRSAPHSWTVSTTCPEEQVDSEFAMVSSDIGNSKIFPNYKHSATTRLIQNLGLRTVPRTARIRLLDPEFAPELPADLAAPYGQLARIWEKRRRPEAVIIVENLATFLALEERRKTVAVLGNGYQAVELWQLQWTVQHDTQLLYWGDLDMDGLSILASVRQWRQDCTSFGMDVHTLAQWSDLAVPDPNAVRHSGRVAPTELTATETTAWEQVITEGLRLEQERLPWSWVSSNLSQYLDRVSGTA